MSLIDIDLSPASHPTIIKPLTSSKSGIVTESGFRFFDNSTIDSFRVCPRRFYYRNIRHFEPEGVKLALVFGTCWHAAMDIVWRDAKEFSKKELLTRAEVMFYAEWEKRVPETPMDAFPRTPTRAMEMLPIYLDKYYDELQRIEVLEIEAPFIVPISDDEKLMYIGKWDKVYRDGKRICILDHKTASSFGSTWIQSFSPNGQMDGYLHAGHMTYANDFWGVMIDGALVQKTNMDFMRVPVQRQHAQLDAWLWETLDYIELITSYEDALQEYRNNGQHLDFMPTFPKCTSACTTYYGACPYLDLCKFWNNPEHEDTPDGMVVHKWEPFSITEADGNFNVEILEHE